MQEGHVHIKAITFSFFLVFVSEIRKLWLLHKIIFNRNMLLVHWPNLLLLLFSVTSSFALCTFSLTFLCSLMFLSFVGAQKCFVVLATASLKCGDIYTKQSNCQKKANIHGKLSQLKASRISHTCYCGLVFSKVLQI